AIFEDATFEILKQEERKIDYREEIKKLPYIFQDPVKFERKIDPKKLRFGSKIDQSDHQRERYYRVKEVLSPEVLILDNGLKIRLIGVKAKIEENGKAMRFLCERLKGQKVFLRFDNLKYDKDENLLCYLYLWNKTFINAHLIKSGLVDVDTTLEYRHKDRFLDLKRSAKEGQIL
ncbi:MAG: thermonuclease family protein, partial [bacterium]